MKLFYGLDQISLVVLMEACPGPGPKSRRGAGLTLPGVFHTQFIHRLSPWCAPPYTQDLVLDQFQNPVL